MAELSVVIVTWNGRHHLEHCLPALFAQTYKDFRLILVDNGSQDGTVAFIREHYPEAETIALDRNYGFAFPNNLGIRKALEDSRVRYVVTLNNDTAPEPGYLTELVACALRHPEAGSVQPKVVNFFESGVIDSTGILIAREMSAINRGQKEMDKGQYELESEIFGPSASAALYTREALTRIALPDRGEGLEFFDNSYFAYYEDVDLAWRLRLAGFASIYAPQAKVLHVHSATGENFSKFKSFHIHRNHYYNLIKNLPLPYLLVALSILPIRYLMLTASLLSRKGPSGALAQNLRKRQESLLRLVLNSWREVIFNLPLLLARRRFIQGKRAVKLHEVNRWFKTFKADYRRIIFG